MIDNDWLIPPEIPAELANDPDFPQGGSAAEIDRFCLRKTLEVLQGGADEWAQSFAIMPSRPRLSQARELVRQFQAIRAAMVDDLFSNRSPEH